MGTEKKSKETFRLQENLEDTSKKQISIYPRTMSIDTCKESKFSNLYIIIIMNFRKFAQEIYFYLLVASLYLIQSKLKRF